MAIHLAYAGTCPFDVAFSKIMQPPMWKNHCERRKPNAALPPLGSSSPPSGSSRRHKSLHNFAKPARSLEVTHGRSTGSLTTPSQALRLSADTALFLDLGVQSLDLNKGQPKGGSHHGIEKCEKRGLHGTEKREKRASRKHREAAMPHQQNLKQAVTGAVPDAEVAPTEVKSEADDLQVDFTEADFTEDPEEDPIHFAPDAIGRVQPGDELVLLEDFECCSGGEEYGWLAVEEIEV